MKVKVVCTMKALFRAETAVTALANGWYESRCVAQIWNHTTRPGDERSRATGGELSVYLPAFFEQIVHGLSWTLPSTSFQRAPALLPVDRVAC